MTNESPEKTRLRASMATLCSIVTNLITPRQERKATILHHLPRWLSSGRAAPATNGNGVPVARARITAGENFNFAKRSQHERKELIPKMKMCATPPLLLGQWKQKVILRNKPA